MRFLSTLLLALILVAACCTNGAYAQRWEFGAGVGGAFYKGDLAPSFNPLFTRPGGQVFAKYNPSYATAFRLNVAYTGLQGDGQRSPDVYVAELQPHTFSTPVFETYAALEYNFLDYRNPLLKRERGTPFLFGGIGIFWFRPGGPETVGTSAIQPMLPFGFGYKYRLSKHLNIAAEFAARKTFTDKLDGVSDIDQRTGWQRGWKFTEDMYGFVGVTVSYTLYAIICPFDYNDVPY